MGLDRPGLEGLKSGGPLGRVAGSARGEMVNVSGGGLRRSFCEADNAMISESQDGMRDERGFFESVSMRSK